MVVVAAPWRTGSGHTRIHRRLATLVKDIIFVIVDGRSIQLLATRVHIVLVKFLPFLLLKFFFLVFLLSSMALDQTKFHTFGNLGLAQHSKTDRVAAVYILVAVGRAAVDDLHLFEVYEDAPRHGVVALVVILGCREYSEHPCALGDSNSLGMSFMSSHDVRESLLLQEVCHSLVTETNGSATTKTVSVSCPSIDRRIFLMLRRRIRPNAIRRHLLIIIILVFVRRVDPRNLIHVQNVLYPSALHTRVRNRTGDTPVNAEDVLIDDSRQRHAIEGRIGHFPHLIAQIVAEPFATLVNKRSGAVVFLPPVHIASLVIPP
mmetsp:Transcript_15051/g.31959  ORF Transcript_15051/g.31959 Transcript_15051/m.31959 type:complete len:318 (-) Transcript_15051:992-1945(-)